MLALQLDRKTRFVELNYRQQDAGLPGIPAGARGEARAAALHETGRGAA